MPNSAQLLVVVATYNEIESISTLVPAIHDALPEADILVIDDGSPDGTGDWCDRYARDNSFFLVHHRLGKLGLGTATIFGLQHALKHGYERVATLDADLSHSPEALRQMDESLCDDSQSGLIIGSRYVAGGKIIGWPWYRRWSSWLVNRYARWAIGLRTYDNTSAFRIYRTSALQKIDLGQVTSQGYSYLEELLVLLQNAGVSAIEHPITFHDRQRGQSKVDLSELARSLFQIVKLSFRRV